MKKNNYIIMYFNKVIKTFLFDQIVAFICLFIYSISNIIFPYLLKLIIDDGIGKNDLRKFVIYSIAMIINIGIMLLFRYLQRKKFLKLGQKIIFKTKESIIERLKMYSMKFFNKYQTGEILSILENDVIKIQDLATTMISDFLVNIVTATGLIIILFSMNMEIALVSILLVTIYVFIQKKYGKHIQNRAIEVSEERGNLYSNTQEFISKINEIRMVNGEKFFYEKYRDKQNHFLKKERKFVMTRIESSVLGMLISRLGLIFVICFGGYKVLNGKMTVGTLFSLTMYIQRIYSPIISLARLYMDIKESKASLERVFKLLKSNEVIKDGSVDFNKQLDGDIEFNNVYFRYDDNVILKNINFKIKNKQKVALLGKNGSGKTSIIRLLLRLWEPYSGSILLDGRNIDEYKLEYLRKNILCIGQEPYIFTGTIKENILLFNDNVSEEQVDMVLEKVCLKEDVDNMVDGLETIVGDKGITLSGGQAQKIALARAFFMDSSIIIFDEPTSALDIKAEEIICKNLFEYFEDRTIIVITHRETILKYCDDVYKIRDNSTHLIKSA